MDVHREAVITKNVFISGGGGAGGVADAKEPPLPARAMRLRKTIELLAQAVGRTSEGVIALGGPWPIPAPSPTANTEGGGDDFLDRLDRLLDRLDNLVQEATDTADRLRSLTG